MEPRKDPELAQMLEEAKTGTSQVLVVVNGYQAGVFTRPNTSAAWVCAAVGDLGECSLGALKPLTGRRRLWWFETDQKISGVDIHAVVPTLVNHRAICQWSKRRDKLSTMGLKGRDKEASAQTRLEVASLAAWRCQLPGCGKDLREHITGKRGNFSYFAHIVAASPEGPRGDKELSEKLADDPSNLMLMCDDCHRLIDRVDPDSYTVERLQQMRHRSIHEVKRLLDTLKYREARMLVIVGNITGQPPKFVEREAEAAMWLRVLRASGTPTWFAHNGGHQHDPHAPDYWGSLFRALKIDMPILQGLLAGTSSGGTPRPEFAVFPLHGTSILILAGRIIGDTAGVHVFQFHRNQISGNDGAQWAWPTFRPEPDPDKFLIQHHRMPTDEVEACLLVSLTFRITPDRLPESCADQEGFKLPTVEITMDNPNIGAIEHPKDLELYGRALDKVLRQIQDEWAIRRIHIFVGAPASACFRTGQKMQARHHASFLCHETAPGGRDKFKPTIEISSTEVLAACTGERIPLLT